jgi:hypothetical protein
MKYAQVQMDEKWPLSSLSRLEADEVLESIRQMEKEIEELNFGEEESSLDGNRKVS